MLKYLKGTKDLALQIGINDFSIKFYIDASYATHADMKSQSGLMLTLGRGAILAQAGKQRIICRSSTEAELVVVSDNVGSAIHLNEFLTYQGYARKPIELFQDNQSCILLVTNGQTSAQRSEHIDVRYYWIKEKIDSGEIIVTYKPTCEMVADGFTKPLQGIQFEMFRDTILGMK